MEVSVANEHYLREQLEEMNSVLKDITQALELEQTKYQVRQVDLSPVLQLEETQLGAQAATTQIQFQLLANRVNLNLALGGGL